MSAFIVSKEHIAYLVNAAVSRNLNPHMLDETGFGWFHNGWQNLAFHDHDRASQVGQMLWDENIKSVHQRYPDDDLDQLPGTIGETYVYSHEFTRRQPHAVQVLKACHCYSYQTCEHDEWESSEAHAFIQALMNSAIYALPGYEEAKWEVEAT